MVVEVKLVRSETGRVMACEEGTSGAFYKRFFPCQVSQDVKIQKLKNKIFFEGKHTTVVGFSKVLKAWLNAAASYTPVLKMEGIFFFKPKKRK